MEYNFKITENGSERSIILKNDLLHYVVDNAIYEVPYSSINAVWLNKPGGLCTPNNYSCTLNIEDDKPIFISSRNWDENKREISQQNHYNSFVRVMHMHLKEKSKAKYGFGVKPKYYFLRVLAILTIISLAVFTALTFQDSWYILIGPVIVSVFVLTCGLNFCVKNFPSKYKPDQIPLRLLPVQS